MKPQSLKQLIKAGKYGWVNEDINDKNFPDFKEMPAEKTELLHFNKVLSSEKLLEEMTKQGYRPANLKELLTFGKDNPEEQRKYHIIGLGSVWRNLYGGRSVPYLWDDFDGRGLSLGWYDRDWLSNDRFLAVRKLADPLTLKSLELPDTLIINSRTYKLVN